MPLFEIGKDQLIAAAPTTFAAIGMKERGGLQRLLKAQIACLDDGLMVLKEEFGEWQDSQRRIDLLCLDTDANLVVVELKRDEDGGHMELQALRYAAMVSSMTFDQAAAALASGQSGLDLDKARAEILSFLGWPAPDENAFAKDVRIILAAANFNKEITTAVLWLRGRYELNIKCIRLTPYQMNDDRVMLDIEQLIPLPEAEEFQTKLGAKRQAEQKDTAERHMLRYEFWEELLATAVAQNVPLHAGRSPTNDGWVSGSIGRTGVILNYVTRRTDSHVEVWISNDKALYEQLYAQREAIEAAFGDELDWQPLPDAMGARIRFVVQGGYRSPATDWPAIHQKLIEAMVKLDAAFRPRLVASKP